MGMAKTSLLLLVCKSGYAVGCQKGGNDMPRKYTRKRDVKPLLVNVGHEEIDLALTRMVAAAEQFQERTERVKPKSPKRGSRKNESLPRAA